MTREISKFVLFPYTLTEAGLYINFIYLFFAMYTYVCLKPEDEVIFPGAGVARNYELPDVGPGN